MAYPLSQVIKKTPNMQMQNSTERSAMDTNSNSPADLACLHFHDQQFEVKQLSEFAFEIESQQIAHIIGDNADTNQVHEGVLEVCGEQIHIQFKTRKLDGNIARFAFFEISLQTRSKLNRLQAELSSPARDSLHSLSYDDLANGGRATGKSATNSRKSDVQPNRPIAAHRASLVKKLAALVMMCTVMGMIGILVVYIIHSRSSVDVYNGVLVGNYVPVNAPLQSSILEWFVKPGDQVNQGDLIARLSNQPVGNDLLLVETKLRRARSELVAFRAEAEQLAATLQFAELKADRDLSVAEAEIQRAQSLLQAAQAQLKRLDPLMSRGNVALAEYDQAKALLATASAELVRQNALKESLTVAKQAVKSNVLVTTNGVSNPMGELTTRISVAEAVVRELEETQSLLQAAVQPVEVRAPASGEVYAIYRNQGETVKVADQLMAISIAGDTWASGTVDIEMAPSIRPGHPVEVSIPSLGIVTEGIVEGIGHRSVYGQEGYHSEFRSGPLEVPIRIALDLKGNSVPSGMRLEMSIRVKNHLKDFKSWIQENVADNISSYWQNGNETNDAVDVKSSINPASTGSDNRNAQSRPMVSDHVGSVTAQSF